MTSGGCREAEIPLSCEAPGGRGDMVAASIADSGWVQAWPVLHTVFHVEADSQHGSLKNLHESQTDLTVQPALQTRPLRSQSPCLALTDLKTECRGWCRHCRPVWAPVLNLSAALQAPPHQPDPQDHARHQ